MRLAPSHFLSRLRRGASSERSPFLAWSDRTSAEVIAETGASPLLATLMSYHWTSYGLPPDQSSFAALAVTTAHYLHGAFHPVGGGTALARAMAETVLRAQGGVVVRAEVARALVHQGRASGVLLSDGTEIRAPIVVSNVGARGTYDWLAPEDLAMRARMHAIGPSHAHVGLYLGLAREPRSLGFDGGNVFIRGVTQDSVDDVVKWCAGERDDPPDLYISSACAIDPSFAQRHGQRTAVMAASGAKAESFSQWAHTGHAHRGDDYNALKSRLGESMLRVIRRYFPLEELTHVEVSTPLSTRDFCGHASGEIYGLAPTPARFRHGPGPRTNTPGLFLTGQDVWTTGVAGAAAGGLLTACAITDRDLFSELALQ